MTKHGPFFTFKAQPRSSMPSKSLLFQLHYAGLGLFAYSYACRKIVRLRAYIKQAEKGTVPSVYSIAKPQSSLSSSLRGWLLEKRRGERIENPIKEAAKHLPLKNLLLYVPQSIGKRKTLKPKKRWYRQVFLTTYTLLPTPIQWEEELQG